MNSAKVPVVEIITIGREILDGRVIDTNSVFLAEKLRDLGLVPRHAQRVDDDIPRMNDAFEIASRRSDVILLTGGLGPTSDDLSAEAFAKFLKEDLEFRSDAFEAVRAYFEKIGRPMTEIQKKQARLPKSVFWIKNTEGSAPGFGLNANGKLWFFMPGVPREMKRMFVEEVVPTLPKNLGYRSHAFATQFTSEGELQGRLTATEKKLPKNFELSYRTRFPENHIGLHGICDTAESTGHFDKLVVEIGATLGADVFCEGVLKPIEEIVVRSLRERKRVFASVESCTGGLIADRITDVPGASDVYWASWILYDNSAKLDFGVPAELIQKHGAVSAPVAGAMAELGLQQLKSLGSPKKPVCLATTGIAGPTGGSTEKPIGLCWIALAEEGQTTVVEEIRARTGLDRRAYKTFFSQKALDLLRRRLLK